MKVKQGRGEFGRVRASPAGSGSVREASCVCIGMGRSRWFKEDIGGLGREEAPPLL